MILINFLFLLARHVWFPGGRRCVGDQLNFPLFSLSFLHKYTLAPLFIMISFQSLIFQLFCMVLISAIQVLICFNLVIQLKLIIYCSFVSVLSLLISRLVEILNFFSIKVLICFNFVLPCKYIIYCSFISVLILLFSGFVLNS